VKQQKNRQNSFYFWRKLSQAEKKKGPVCSQNDLKANTITNKNLVPKVK